MVKFDNLENVTDITIKEIYDQYVIIKYIYYENNNNNKQLIESLQNLYFVNSVDTDENKIIVKTDYIIVNIDQYGISDNFTIYHNAGSEIWSTCPTCNISVWQIADALDNIDLIFK